MIELNKTTVIASISSAVAGAALIYFIKPTEIKTEVKTVEVVKKEKENVYVDRFITKITKPDGTIEEKTVEQDRTKIDRQERIDEEVKTKIITNPRNFSLGLAYKANADDFTNIVDYSKNLGVEVQFDTGILNTYIGGTAFLDKTIIVELGFRF